MTNYTVAHESHRANRVAQGQLAYASLKYPPNHIEVDNRLSWFLGTLDKEYGDTAFYVHLIRDQHEVAKSLAHRSIDSIVFSYAWGPLQYGRHTFALSDEFKLQASMQYWRRVNDNIELFLRDKTQKLTIWLADIQEVFPRFWEAIGARGDLERALNEWNTKHNVTKTTKRSWHADVEHYCNAQKANQEITQYIPPGSKLVLVDDHALDTNIYLENRELISMGERNDGHWSPSADDESAICELEHLREKGAQYLVLLWPSFWWLSHYKDLERYLRVNHKCIFKSPRAVIYDLDAESD